MSYYKTEKPQLPAGTSVGCLATWIGTRGDYQGAAEKAKSITGWRRYTSTHHMEGRLTGAFVSFALIGCVIGYSIHRIKMNREKITKKAS